MTAFEGNLAIIKQEKVKKYWYLKICYWEDPSDVTEFDSFEEAHEVYQATVDYQEPGVEYIALVAVKGDCKKLLARHNSYQQYA